MEVGRNIRIAMVKTSNISGLQDFTKPQNMHNSSFRCKLDISGKICKVLTYKGKLTF